MASSLLISTCNNCLNLSKTPDQKQEQERKNKTVSSFPLPKCSSSSSLKIKVPSSSTPFAPGSSYNIPKVSSLSSYQAMWDKLHDSIIASSSSKEDPKTNNDENNKKKKNKQDQQKHQVKREFKNCIVQNQIPILNDTSNTLQYQHYQQHVSNRTKEDLLKTIDAARKKRKTEEEAELEKLAKAKRMDLAYALRVFEGERRVLLKAKRSDNPKNDSGECNKAGKELNHVGNTDRSDGITMEENKVRVATTADADTKTMSLSAKFNQSCTANASSSGKNTTPPTTLLFGKLPPLSPFFAFKVFQDQRRMLLKKSSNNKNNEKCEKSIKPTQNRVLTFNSNVEIHPKIKKVEPVADVTSWNNTNQPCSTSASKNSSSSYATRSTSSSTSTSAANHCAKESSLLQKQQKEQNQFTVLATTTTMNGPRSLLVSSKVELAPLHKGFQKTKDLFDLVDDHLALIRKRGGGLQQLKRKEQSDYECTASSQGREKKQKANEKFVERDKAMENASDAKPSKKSSMDFNQFDKCNDSCSSSTSQKNGERKQDSKETVMNGEKSKRKNAYLVNCITNEEPVVDDNCKTNMTIVKRIKKMEAEKIKEDCSHKKASKIDSFAKGEKIRAETEKTETRKNGRRQQTEGLESWMNSGSWEPSRKMMTTVTSRNDDMNYEQTLHQTNSENEHLEDSSKYCVCEPPRLVRLTEIKKMDAVILSRQEKYKKTQNAHVEGRKKYSSYKPRTITPKNRIDVNLHNKLKQQQKQQSQKTRLQDSWSEMFKNLCTYKKEKGHCRATPEGEHIKLYHWIRYQNKRLEEGRMPKDQKARLDSVGFEWKGFESKRRKEGS